MLLCVLETRFQRDPALSFSISSPGSSRSILDLQHLIEEAWKEGEQSEPRTRSPFRQERGR